MTTMQARILIADDEETFRESSAAILAEDGYQCDVAQNAAEAEQLLQRDYDLLIVDIRMPGNTQLEFLQMVATRYPDLPVVVATGYPSVNTAVASFRLAIVDYLIKPVDLEDLKRAVTLGIQNREILCALKEASIESSQLSGALTGLQRILGSRMIGKGSAASEWTAAAYVGQAMSHIARLSLLVGKTVEAIRRGQTGEATDVCSLMRCPRLDTYERAIEDAIQVMERTRSSFKSKEIGMLRERLESILRENQRKGEALGGQ